MSGRGKHQQRGEVRPEKGPAFTFGLGSLWSLVTLTGAVSEEVGEENLPQVPSRGSEVREGVSKYNGSSGRWVGGL